MVIPYLKTELWLRPPQHPARNDQHSRTNSFPKLLCLPCKSETNRGSQILLNQLPRAPLLVWPPSAWPSQQPPIRTPLHPSLSLPQSFLLWPLCLPWSLFQTHVMVANALATASRRLFLFGLSSFASMPLKNKVWDGKMTFLSRAALDNTTKQLLGWQCSPTMFPHKQSNFVLKE